MRSTLFIGCLFLAVVYVHSLTRIERVISVQKRAASPQVYRAPPNTTFSNPANSSQQFQWTKVNNQWVRTDGKSLPGYSPANVPYNQSGGWNANRNPTQRPRPVEGWGVVVPGNRPPQTPKQPQPQIPQRPQPQTPQRQNSQSSGGVGWNPNADRALTQDIPHTTPRPVPTTTPAPFVPQTPPPAYNPPAPTPPPNAPFGSGAGYQQRPQTGFNPDARLSYGGMGPGPTQTNQRAKVTPRPGANPWGGIF